MANKTPKHMKELYNDVLKFYFKHQIDIDFLVEEMKKEFGDKPGLFSFVGIIYQMGYKKAMEEIINGK